MKLIANWTVATAYQRMQAVLEEETGLAFDDIDIDNFTLGDIKETFERRIVKDAMAGANRVPIGGMKRPGPKPKRDPSGETDDN